MPSLEAIKHKKQENYIDYILEKNQYENENQNENRDIDNLNDNLEKINLHEKEIEKEKEKEEIVDTTINFRIIEQENQNLEKCDFDELD